MNVAVLQLKTSDNFQINLLNLILKIKSFDQPTFILAPELTLTGYAYNRLDDATDLTNEAIKKLKPLSHNHTIALTMTTKHNDQFYNTLHIFHKGQIIHTQSKHQLFVLNDERVYFSPGKLDDIKIIDIDGVKVASLICFELRFVDLWKRIQGADIVLVPAMWGVKRKQNFETLTKGLAVLNQCFVLASDSANDDMAKSSGIIEPFGEEYRDDNLEILEKTLDLKQIKTMRRYMQVGI
ncbi:MAG: carbon-nitrogen hydrolase family protein [Campylobacterales bacterium]|nr:carbon-nitrogen hydrolase family protein [Campylobacterales bacterium]